jgi:hypothetical protein
MPPTAAHRKPDAPVAASLADRRPSFKNVGLLWQYGCVTG